MKKHCFGIVLLMCGAAYAADITPLDVKPGEWETTATTQTSGAPTAAIPPETLAKLPPEQRAKVEAALKQASGPNTTVVKRCVKKEDMGKPLNLGTNRAGCKETLVNSSSNKQEIHIDCDDKGVKSTGVVRVEAVNSENIKVDMQIAAVSNGRTLNISNTATSKWIGAVCTDKQ